MLWLISGKGNAAIAFSIMADALAALPTVVKAYREPETESYQVFLNGALSAAITLLTIDTWAFAYYGFKLYIMICCLVLFVLIKLKPQKAKLAKGV